MKKIILITVLLFTLFGLGAYASNQKYVILEPNETKYIDPYQITNDTNRKIFAPYTDSSDNILGNIKGVLDINTGEKSFNFMGAKSEAFKTYSQNMFKFNSMQKLNNTFNIGGFSVKDASYSWSTGTYGSCSKTCGGGVQYRTVTCKRGDGNLVDDSLCSSTDKPGNFTSCNVEACIVTCNSSNVGKFNISGEECVYNSIIKKKVYTAKGGFIRRYYDGRRMNYRKNYPNTYLGIFPGSYSYSYYTTISGDKYTYWTYLADGNMYCGRTINWRYAGWGSGPVNCNEGFNLINELEYSYSFQ